MRPQGRWIYAAVLAIGSNLLATVPEARSHDHPTDEQIAKAKQDGSYDRRMQVTLRMNPHRMDPNLQRRARFKLQYEALKAQGVAPAEIGRRLLGGPQMAFPFAANPELPSNGTVRTLTVLVDFKNDRAATRFPGVTAATVAPNIYGTGTTTADDFKPFESVSAYYTRASEGKVNVQGNVLGWYGFPKERSEYDSDTTNDLAHNQALFKLVTEALDSFDASHDFTQYDNDNDGDIDLVTILYCAPPPGEDDWGTFWWAYRWQFFVQQADTKLYDGKRLRQFVFQFVDRRGANNDDFNPTTLIHEMGHAFGLADYYDYDRFSGNQGGVGGLDMMDNNRGNHCAFSRWLLDWIQPEVIGSGSPAVRQLVASGSTLPGTKAIAIFPNLANSTSPGQELFLIENRFRVGNDETRGGSHSDGLLIWHVDARPNSSNTDFLQDNSFTQFKLIRLVRADSGNDFVTGESASAATYYQAGKEFTPQSTPRSHDNGGTLTGVSVTNISPNAETMTALIGVQPAPGPTPAPPLGGPESVLARMNRDVIEMIGPQNSPTGVEIEPLIRLARDLQTAPPATMETLWKSFLGTFQQVGTTPDTVVMTRLILSQWAAKDGAHAAQAALNLPEGDLRRDVFPLVMEAWASANPSAAKAWYFDPAQEELRNSASLTAGQNFAHLVTRHTALSDVDEAIRTVGELRNTPEVWGALNALDAVREQKGLSLQTLSEKLKATGLNEETVRTAQQFRDILHQLDDHVTDPKTRDEMRDMILQRLDRP